MTPTPSVYGRGFSFPFRFDADQARPSFSSEEQLVKESISSIINTDITERPHLSRGGVPFGTRMNRMIFENVDTVIDVAKYDIPRALATWEPRIIVLGVKATSQPSKGKGTTVYVNVTFRYRATSRVDNLVIPFIVGELPAAA